MIKVADRSADNSRLSDVESTNPNRFGKLPTAFI
jgi:hypothetical protein